MSDSSFTPVSVPQRNSPNNTIRRPRYLPLSSLESHSLYILTYVDTKWFVRGEFGWALYHHKDAEHGRVQYQIHGSSFYWLAGHRKRKAICKDSRLIGLFRISSIEVSDIVVRKIITKEDKVLNDIDVDELTSKIWVGRAVERLIEAKALNIECGWNTQEDEVCQFSNMHWQSAFENVQPRPTATLRLAMAPARDKTCIIC